MRCSFSFCILSSGSTDHTVLELVEQEVLVFPSDDRLLLASEDPFASNDAPEVPLMSLVLKVPLLDHVWLR